MKPPPVAAPESFACASPARRRALLGTALRWLGEGLLFTPVLAYYACRRGLTRSLPMVAMENLLYLRLFAACLPLPTTVAADAKGLRPVQGSTQRRACAFAVGSMLVFLHSFLIGSQITALALMGTRMNAAFIYNIVHALKTDTWTDTDAKFFFPTVVILTLATEWASLLGWWPRLARAALRPALAAAASHQRRLTPALQRALHRWRKALDPAGAHDDEGGSAAAAEASAGTRPLRGWRLALAFAAFWAFKHRCPFLPKRAAYSPVANAFFACVRYAARDEFGQAQAARLKKRGPAAGGQAHAAGRQQQPPRKAKPYFERVALPPLAETRKSNVVFILNDSLGNRILKSTRSLEAYPFYRDRILSGEDPAFFDFANNRACSGNTNSAAPAALTGYFLGAKDFHPDSWDYWTLPQVYTLARRMGYTRALFCPYDSEDWWPFNDIFDKFDRVTSRSTLGAPVVNDMGMDDRLVMAEAVKYIEEQGRRQREGGADAPPFVMVLMWNNMHRPFLKKGHTELQAKRRNAQYRDKVAFKNLFMGTQGEEAAAAALSITQEMTADLFAALDRAGLRDSTLVSFLSDHGESTAPSSTRLGGPTSLYLASPLWLHVPPPILAAAGPDAAAALRGNRDRLTSNLDLMPTLVELLGWSAEPALFRDVPAIFGHGQSLLRPVAPDRVAAGWQGQPFVDACEWTFGMLYNATHTLILRAEDNDAVLEEVGGADKADAVRTWGFGELGPEDQAYWRRELVEKRPDMYEALRQCYWTYDLGHDGDGGEGEGKDKGAEKGN